MVLNLWSKKNSLKTVELLPLCIYVCYLIGAHYAYYNNKDTQIYNPLCALIYIKSGLHQGDPYPFSNSTQF